MKIAFDLDSGTASIDGREIDIAGDEAFSALANLWTVVGWRKKYSYRFTWLGRPIIQLPEDIIRIQELIWRVKPDVLIECGVAHGGSLILYASLFEAMGKGRVVGVDIDIRQHNRQAVESHRLASRITLIQGNSIDRTIVDQVQQHIHDADVVLVVLDSNHSKDHVLGELRAYGAMVSPRSYIVATDGVMQQLAGGPRAPESWREDNPKAAAEAYLQENNDFVLAPPPPLFDESEVSSEPTYWPGAYLLRRT
jgi:cephalosporin hydroxylase